jgi:uncharacterized 2Fe-2S/4Fe-4S cluster protein (DUF4445 family)
MAALLDCGLLLPRGSLNREISSEYLTVDSNVIKYVLASRRRSSTLKDIYIAQTDIRMLQQSKAAIRAAIDMLFRKSGSHSDEISVVYLTGVFGTGLRVDDAYRIGMFPHFQNATIRQERNGAVKGAGLLLFEENRMKIDRLVTRLNYVELTEEDEFREMFVASIPFPSK